MKLVIVGFMAALVIVDSERASADFILGEPVNIGSLLNSTYADLTPSISSDGLEIYFWSNRPGGFGGWDLWVSMRPSTEEVWLPATNLGAKVNSSGIEALPCISADGLELFFSRGGQTTADLMAARRTARTEPWGTADKLGPVVNSSVRDDSPRLTSDGLELYFISSRTGGRGLSDIWVASRPTTRDDWGPPSNLHMVNSSDYEQWLSLSGDGLTLLFQSTRPGGEYGGLYMSKRKSKDDPWTVPVYLGLPMNGSVYTLFSSVSADGTMLYLSDHVNYAPRAGGVGSADMWQVPISPVVDLNEDGRLDLKDFCKLAQCWKQDEPTVDIGPTPLGDGLIDFQDLAVFAEHFRLGGRPMPASNPSPPDGATGVSITAFLTWTAGPDVESQEVYFGTAAPPLFVRTQTEATYAPAVMEKNTAYYWRVDLANENGTTTGQTWSFTTETGGGR